MAIYHFSIAWVKEQRKTSEAPAGTGEKVLTYLGCVGACLILSTLLSIQLGTHQEDGDGYRDAGRTVVDYEPTTEEHLNYGAEVFFVVLPASLIGIYVAFQKDKTMSLDERYGIKRISKDK